MNTTVNNNGAAESSVAATTESNPYLQPILKGQAKAPTNAGANSSDFSHEGLETKPT